MGMSSSQIRLLSLTSRKSDLEYRAQSITNAKLALSRKADAASRDYIAALDKQVLTVKNTSTNGYEDANVYNMTTYGLGTTSKQRFIKNTAGEVLTSKTVNDRFKAAETYVAGTKAAASPNGWGTTDLNTFLDKYLKYHDQASATANGQTYDAKTLEYYKNMFSGSESFMQNFGITSNTQNTNQNLKYDAQAVDYYQKMYNEMQENGAQVLDDTKLKDPDWLYEGLTNGTLFISEYDTEGGEKGTGDFVNISWNSGDPSLATDDMDSTALAKVEAEYELATREIAEKDKRFDMDLKTIDTEHNAIQTEMDSVKKVIDKNIEKTFKIFDA